MTSDTTIAVKRTDDTIAPDFPVTAKTDNYTVVAGDAAKEFEFNKASAVTCSLPAAATAGNGFNLILRNIGSGDLTVDPNGAETIDGESTLTVSTDETYWIRCDGSNWRSLSRDQSRPVFGPVTTTENSIALWDTDDNNKKRIKDGLALGTSGQVLTSNGTGSAPSFQDAGGGGASDATRANVLLNALRISKDGGLSVQNMVDGVVDAFEDESGVDTGASSGETYDGTGDYYHNYGGYTQVPQVDGDAIDTGTTEFGYADREIANAFNGTQHPGSGSSACTDNTSSDAAIGKDWSELKEVGRAIIYGCSDTSGIWANKTYDVTLRGWNGSSWVELATLAISSSPGYSCEHTIDYSGGVTYTKHDVLIDNSNGTEQICVGELEFFSTNAPDDMTLISESVTAKAEPDEAFIVLWEEDMETLTLNTDIKAWASCDGGTNWAQATLSDKATLSTGRVLTGTADVSSQTGTSMKWKVTTHNSKELRLHGVGMEWS